MVLQFSVGWRIQVLTAGAARYALPGAGDRSLDAFGDRVACAVEFAVVLGKHIFRRHCTAARAARLKSDGQRAGDTQERLLLGRVLANGSRGPGGDSGLGMRKINDAAGENIGWIAFVHPQARIAFCDFRFEHGLQVSRQIALVAAADHLNRECGAAERDEGGQFAQQGDFLFQANQAKALRACRCGRQQTSAEACGKLQLVAQRHCTLNWFVPACAGVAGGPRLSPDGRTGDKRSRLLLLGGLFLAARRRRGTRA